MLIAIWDGRPEPPADECAGEWLFAGIALQRGWHEQEGGKTCWAVLSWLDGPGKVIHRHETRESTWNTTH
jgi:hypothetical protein